MFVKITSNRAWSKIKNLTLIKDYHYHSEKHGICHIQEIPDNTNLDRIKGVKIVKRIPKEKLFPSQKTLMGNKVI